MCGFAAIILCDIALRAIAIGDDELAAAELRRKIAADDFQSHEFAPMAYSLAMSGKSHTKEFTALVKAVKRHASEFGPHDIASMAWTFAMVVRWDLPLFTTLAAVAARHVSGFTPEDLANIAWAFAAANVYPEQLFGPTFLHRCKSARWWTGPVGQRGLQQLNQWVLWHMELGLPAPLAPVLRERCLAASRTARSPTEIHREVAAALSKLVTGIQELVQIHDGYIIDVVVQWEGKVIGVLVEDPDQFLGGPVPRSAHGGTLLKRRQLRAMKWRLETVPYWEWDEVKNNETKKREYLLRTLQSAMSRSRVESLLRGDPTVAVIENVTGVRSTDESLLDGFASTSNALGMIGSSFVRDSLSSTNDPTTISPQSKVAMTPPSSERERQLQWFNEAMAQVNESASQLEELSRSWDTLAAAGSMDEETTEGMQLIREFHDLQDILNKSNIIDVAVPLAKSRDMCTDPNIRRYGQMTEMLFKVDLRQTEWQLQQLEKIREPVSSSSVQIPGMTSEEIIEAVKEIRAKYLLDAAKLQIRLLNFKGAHENIKRCLAVNSTIPTAKLLAPYCALIIAAHNPEVLRTLEPHDTATAHLLAALRDTFQSCDYTVKNVLRVTKVRTMSAFIHVEITGAAIETKLLESPQVVGSTIADLIRLFLLHRIISLERLAVIVGDNCCELLLKLSVVTAVWGVTMSILSPANAVRALREGKAVGLSVFSNIQLRPVEEDLLVATDYHQTFSTETMEPVMYMSADSIALLASAPRFPHVSRVLDVCSGSGVQGIVALRYYAQEAVFTDKNPRALSFTRFNLLLNRMGHRGEVFVGDLYRALPDSAEKFDAIIANVPFTPNPRGIASGASAMFGNGGDTGDDVFKGLFMGARAWLRKGTGRLIAASVVSNIEGLPERLRAWYGSSDGAGITPAENAAHFDAVIFHGTQVPPEKFYEGWLNITEGSLQAIQYYACLKSMGLRTLAESIIMLRPAQAPVTKSKISFVTDCKNLWSNMSYLATACQSALKHI